MRRLATLFLALVLVLVAAGAWGFWTTGSVAGGAGRSVAATVNAGATPSATVSGQAVTLTWSASTLSTGQAVAGYLVSRYDAGTLTPQTVLAGCTGTVAATTCTESGVPPGSWKYAVTPVIGTSWRGAESARSATVVVATPDPTAPTNAVSLSSVSGGAYLAGTTVYYRGTATGSFRVTNAVADAGSGPASSTTAALTGTATGWSHTPSTVSTPAGGPYVSAPFDWSAGTTSSPGETVTGRDVAGNTATTNLTFTNDSTAPTAGTIGYPDGISGRTVSVSFTTGTDAGSGIASRRLQRAAATLTDSTCGSFGSFTDIGSDGPTSPYSDSGLAKACYKYRYVVTDRVGNQDVATSASTVKVGYTAAVYAAPGLLSYWRFGDGATAAPISSDSFTGAAGSLLTSHTGELAAGWTRQDGGADATISNEGRVYRASVLGGYTVNTASLVPANPDYSVEADLVLKTAMSSDMVGVVGRLTSPTTFYMGRWEEADNSWNLVKYSNGTLSYPNYVANQPDLTAGQAYHLKLEMTGSTLNLYVDGVLKVTATDSTITAAGRAGIMDGDRELFASNPAKSNTTGLHLDNFQVTSTYRALDSKGTNHGQYLNGVTRGVTGALTGDNDTAAQFDGVNDYVQMTGTSGIPAGSTSRSVEAWFKTSSSARQVLFDYGSLANTQEFGLWIDAGGATMTAWGWGTGNDKQFTMPSAVNNGAWHQVVLTYNGTTLTLYIDGVALPTQAATRSTVMNAYGFGIGAVITPGDGNSGGYFNGSIDEVSFYTSVLDQATVTTHFQLGGAPSADTSGPTGGSVDATGLVGTGSRYAASTTLSLALAKGTDPSGLASSGNQLLRASASLTNGTCGAFGSYTLVTGGTDPTTPTTDTVADQACYSYQYVVADSLGNTATFTSPAIKVDLTAPAAPTLSFGGLTNTYWSGTGSTVYYRSAAASGSVTVTASATDAAGIASYSYPALGTGWTATPGATGVTTYSWATASPAVPGTVGVTATNNATLSSAGGLFTLTADDAGPAGGSVGYAGGVTTGTSVSVSFAAGSDQTGIGTRLLQRASATLTGATCGTFGNYATVTGGTNPSSPLTDTVTPGSCYKYQYVVADGVGNLSTYPSSNVLRVGATYGQTILSTTGLVSYWHLGESSGATTMVDSFGTNNGTYAGSPSLGATGAIVGSSDTAMQLNGTNQYSTAARQIGDDLSIEFWFKSSQVAGSTCTQWWQGMRLIDAETNGASSDFGVSLCSGKIIGGVGSSADVSIVSPGTYNNNAWHHVVFTRTKSPAAMQLYVDGASVVSGTPNNSGTLSASSILAFGRAASGSTGFYAGLLDEVAVYGTVLSAATISNHYQVGTTALDTSGPTGGSVDASGLVGTGARYAASTTLSLDLAAGTDPSGVATSGNQVLRASSSLTDGQCGSFGSYAVVSGGTDPSSPLADTVDDQACYSYRYVVLDTLGNATTYTSPAIKVDLTAPAAPSLAFSAFTNAYGSGSGDVYYRSTASAGSFRVTATATDAAGIAAYTFPTLGTGWASAPGSLGVTTYSWSTANPAAPGTKNVTATNNAGATSGTAPFTLTADDTAPTAGTVTYPGGTTKDTTVSVGFTTGTDAASGIGTRLLQRASAPLTGSTCGSYGAFSTVATNPASSPVVDTVTSGSCYKYQYVVSDNVGNTHTATGTGVVAVSPTYLETVLGTSGLLSFWRLGEAQGAASAVDSKGTNTGTYNGGPTLGVTGAIAGEASTAVTFNGVNQWVSVSRTIQDDFSIEFWFKSTQGIGTGSQWWSGAGLVDAEVGGGGNDFGVSLRSDGKILAGDGAPDTSVVTTGSYNNGAWHHVVFTRTRASGVLSLYVDGAAAGTATGNTVSLTGPASINFGRIQSATNYLAGSLDEVALYTTPLSAATVLSHYNAGR